jgi:hypothetical protein
MKGVVVSLIAFGTLLGSLRAAANATCPRTVVSFDALGPPLFSSDLWYGGESFAVLLPPDGFWPTTAFGARIAVKTFWRSAAFRLGTESMLKVEVENLRGGPMTARVTRPTNAYLGTLSELSESEREAILYETAGSRGKWTMLVGIDFPDPGCWRGNGEYLGQKLTFVVETV